MKIKKQDSLICITFKKNKRFLNVINEHLFRIFYAQNDTSLFDMNENVQTCDISIKKNKILINDYEFIFDNSLRLLIKKNEEIIFEEYEENYQAIKEEKIQKTNINIKLYDKSYVYGLGDKAKFLNHKGYEFISYNTDDPTPQNEQYKSLYKSINYLLVNHHNNKYFGIFYPSTFKTYFNIAKDKFDLLNISSLRGENDYFLILGDDPDSITKNYVSLIGMPVMPTLKMLGNQQSRWSYYSSEEVKEIAAASEVIVNSINNISVVAEETMAITEECSSISNNFKEKAEMAFKLTEELKETTESVKNLY